MLLLFRNDLWIIFVRRKRHETLPYSLVLSDPRRSKIPKFSCAPNVTEVNSSPEILSAVEFVVVSLSFSSGFSIFLSLSLKPGRQTNKLPRFLAYTHTRKSNLSNLFFPPLLLKCDGNEANGRHTASFRFSFFIHFSSGTPDRVIVDRTL